MLGIKRLVLTASRRAGVNTLVASTAWRDARLVILCYHGVSLDDEHVAWPDLYLPPDLFRRRLEHLRARRCNILPLGDALERLRAGSLPPRSVAITFDDGTQDFARRAVPLLQEFDVPATVYVATYYSGRGQPIFDTALRYVLWRGRETRAELGALAGTPEPLTLGSREERLRAGDALMLRARAESMGADEKDALLRRVAEAVGLDYDAFVATGMFQIMTPAQIRTLPHDLIGLGLHTHRHRLPAEAGAFARELADNRTALHSLGATALTHFCYPNGEYRADVRGWLRSLGVASATTCVPGVAGRDGDPFLLPRVVDTCGVSDVAFDAWVTGVADLLPRRREYRLDPAIADAEPGQGGAGAPYLTRRVRVRTAVHERATSA